MKHKHILRKYQRASPEQQEAMYNTLIKEIADLSELAREMEKAT